MRCAEVREALPAYVRGGEASLAVRRHLSRCGPCRAELARYESLLSALGGLHKTTTEPPPGLAAILAAIPQRAGRLAGARSHVARNRNAYLGGAAVAALAGAAGTAIWRARRGRVAVARA